MRFSKIVAGVALVPIAVAMLAAQVPEGCYLVDDRGTEDPADDLVACEQQTYFHETETKAANLSNVDDSPQSVPSWDTEAPTQSVQDGGGAGFLSLSSQYPQDGAATAVFEGTFEGVLDAMDFDLFLLRLWQVAPPDDISLTIEVDGIAVFSGSEIEVNQRPAPTGDAAVQQDFTVTGIASALEQFGDGADGTHEIRIEVTGYFIDSGNWIYVFDTTEVPAGIRFNPVEADPNARILQAF